MLLTLVAFVCALPPEIHSLIFLYTIGPYSFAPKPYAILRTNICLVCRLWRDIMYSTPLAWNSIYVSVDWYPSTRLVPYGVKRSGAICLDVYLDCGSVTEDADTLERAVESNALSALVHAVFCALEFEFSRVARFTAICRNKIAGTLIHSYLARMDCRQLRALWLAVHTGPRTEDQTDLHSFSSSLPSLRNLHASSSMPPRLCAPLFDQISDLELSAPMCGRMSELDLICIIEVMEPSWTELRAFLRAMPNLESIRLAGVACTGIIGSTHSDSLLFERLRRIDFVFSHRSMVDVLSTFVAPILAQLRLDLIPGCPIRYFVTACTQLLSVPQTVDIRWTARVGQDVVAKLYRSISSATTLDFSRSPAFRAEAIITSLTDKLLRLPRVDTILLPTLLNTLDVHNILLPLKPERLHADCVLISPSTEGGLMASRGVNDSLVTYAFKPVV
ncbi:hypothetical protein C8R44DRAFT_741959 [Mycena epipterygia]|nr:hypothetical protein C8R44DRAFT_741959 [Mycena epipterygia]